MCRGNLGTVLKVSGLFFLLLAILFSFLFLTFFRTYELNLRVLSSGFLSLFFTTMVWGVILEILHSEENPRKQQEQENEELIEVVVSDN